MNPIKNFDPDFADPSEYARLYRDMGIQVVPSQVPKMGTQWKRPAVNWRQYENELTSEETFNEWYGTNGKFTSRANMGIITGKASGGKFVIDLDTYKNSNAGGWWSYIQSVATNLAELETATQTTGGGGKQLIFQAPDGWTPPTCKTSIGVDIRGQGGFAVLTPSRHESGKFYTWDEGLEPWAVGIAVAPKWLCDEIDKLAAEHGGSTRLPEGTTSVTTPTPLHAKTPFGSIVDGREDYMAKMIWAAVVSLRRDAPMMSHSLMEKEMHNAFSVYERKVKSRLVDHNMTNAELLERECRGITEFSKKWWAAYSQWEDKVTKHAEREPSKREEPAKAEDPVYGKTYSFDPETGEILVEPLPDGAFSYMDVGQIKAMKDPDYLVDKIIAENSFGLTGGAPGGGKSFLVQGLSLSIACGLDDWFGFKIRKSGPVIYITNEGLADIKYRIMAWEQHFNVKADEAPFYLISQSINFMHQDDIMKLLKTVGHIAKIAEMPVMVVIDTVSRVLPGADENLQKDMTLFIGACDAVRQAFKCSVMGVHHTSRNGNLRGSTVFEGAADFILMVQRESGEDFGTIKAQKIKYAPDGWDKTFEMKKVNIGQFGGKESLVAIPSSVTANSPAKWPEKPLLRTALIQMQQDFNDKKGWGRPNSNFPAVAMMVRYTQVTDRLAQQIIDTWVKNGVIEIAIYDPRSKAKGYRVIGAID